MLLNNEKIFVMLLQEGFVEYILVRGCHVMVYALWDFGADYKENIFPGDPCSWALCGSAFPFQGNE